MEGTRDGVGACGEEFYAVFDVGDATGVAEFADCDGVGGGDAVLRDPGG